MGLQGPKRTKAFEWEVVIKALKQKEVDLKLF
jgi:hypothetical protein